MCSSLMPRCDNRWKAMLPFLASTVDSQFEGATAGGDVEDAASLGVVRRPRIPRHSALSLRLLFFVGRRQRDVGLGLEHAFGLMAMSMRSLRGGQLLTANIPG